MAWHVWPRSLAARTTLVMALGLGTVQVGGLLLHAFDRRELLRMAQEHELSRRAMVIYRDIALAPPEARRTTLDQVNHERDFTASLHATLPAWNLPPLPPEAQQHIRADLATQPMPAALRPRNIVLLGTPRGDRMVFGLEIPDGEWLQLETPLSPVWPWQSPVFLGAFAAMSSAALLLTLWGVNRLTRPVGTLAAAAEALGRDVKAPPLPETGPTEVATAAAAFNTMAARIRRFVDDRTFLITALGHDLRTPITRLRLRAEFMDDDEQRRRMLADLDELEAMISATLAFGRDATLTEPATAVDLPALLQTVLQDAADARPQLDPAATAYVGPANLTVHVRPVALKRALSNLVANALNYGGSAQAELMPASGGMVTLHIDDTGPGIPPDEMERVFLPFHRLEESRNRETGGVGLGLPISRDILRAHGGDVVLRNRPRGGLRATVSLPA